MGDEFIPETIELSHEAAPAPGENPLHFFVLGTVSLEMDVFVIQPKTVIFPQLKGMNDKGLVIHLSVSIYSI